FMKTCLLFLVMVRARRKLPRLRYAQLMAFAWKILLPLSLVNLVLAAVVQELRLMELPSPLLLVINLLVVWVVYQLYSRGYLAAQRRVAPPILATARAAAEAAPGVRS